MTVRGTLTDKYFVGSVDEPEFVGHSMPWWVVPGATNLGNRQSSPTGELAGGNLGVQTLVTSLHVNHDYARRHESVLSQS